MKAAWMLLGLIALATAGWWFTVHFGWQGVERTLGFSVIAAATLFVGLFMAANGIDHEEANRHWKIALLAVTVGVVLKYFVIVGATLLVTHDPKFFILSMAVAQIDPLSVAAMSDDGRMSERIKTVLRIWASFDDPVTTILVAVILLLHVNLNEGTRDAAAGGIATDLAPYFALMIIGTWFIYRRRRTGEVWRGRVALERSEPAKNAVLAAGGIATVATRWYAIAALLGWYLRPAWLEKPVWKNAPAKLCGLGRGSYGTLITWLALTIATLMLGMLLAGGVNLKEGLVLGFATYLSQIAVAWLLVWIVGRKESRENRFSARETWQLALGQQNGITAIILAVNLELVVPGSVAVIAVAIPVVNLCHLVANGAFNRFNPA